MSNVVALHAFSNNEPLQTIVEAANSDYEATERNEAHPLRYEDIYHGDETRIGTDEWRSSTSESSGRLDEDRGSPRLGARLRSGRGERRTRYGGKEGNTSARWTIGLTISATAIDKFRHKAQIVPIMLRCKGVLEEGRPPFPAKAPTPTPHLRCSTL